MKCKNKFSAVPLSALELVSSVSEQLNRWKRSETKGKHFLTEMLLLPGERVRVGANG